jgi:hypothetical protein
MEAIVKKKKYKVFTLYVSQLERHKPFEIKIPANVKKVSGIIITATAL